VVSIVDDRNSTPGRQLVCFGTKSTTTNALEVFTLREEVRDWDRPLAEEHLDQLFSRHFKKLESGAKWQDAFITGPSARRSRRSSPSARNPAVGDNEEELRKTLRASSTRSRARSAFLKKSANQNRRLEMVELP
jgi:hypothetical protein